MCIRDSYSYEEAELKNLYTPEAYQLCKRLEFKNLLSKFDTAVVPENPIEQNFFVCNDLSGADALFKKAAGKAYVGISLLADKESVYGLSLIHIFICGLYLRILKLSSRYLMRKMMSSNSL